jgi:Rrf2 family protein
LLAAGYLARHQKQGIILSQTISEKYNIPLEYLLKILQQLVKANLLRSKRGPRGGFSLAKPAKKITLLEVIEAVDGPMVCQLHLAEHAKGERFASRVEQTYNKAIAQAKVVFSKTKVGDLLGG